jgi:hypothetical protein
VSAAEKKLAELIEFRLGRWHQGQALINDILAAGILRGDGGEVEPFGWTWTCLGDRHFKEGPEKPEWERFEPGISLQPAYLQPFQNAGQVGEFTASEMQHFGAQCQRLIDWSIKENYQHFMSLRTTQPQPVHGVDSLEWLEKAILHEFGTEETGWQRGEMVVARLDSLALFIQETEQSLLNRQDGR